MSALPAWCTPAARSEHGVDLLARQTLLARLVILKPSLDGSLNRLGE
jgi:hypothetical protein